MNGEPSAEYPLNKFSPKEKGLDSDSFYDGRDGRHWMLGTLILTFLTPIRIHL